MADGWLIDHESFWIARFYRDEKASVRDPKVFVDYGRGMTHGQSALLKSERRHLKREDAAVLWKALRSSGWKTTDPAWGTNSEP